MGVEVAAPVRKLTLHNKLHTLGPLSSPILEANLKLGEGVNGRDRNIKNLEHFYNVWVCRS